MGNTSFRVTLEIKNPRVRICVEDSFEFFVVKRKRKCKSLMAHTRNTKKPKNGKFKSFKFRQKVAVENQFYK